MELEKHHFEVKTKRMCLTISCETHPIVHVYLLSRGLPQHLTESLF